MVDYDLTDRRIFPVWSETTVRYSDLDPNNHVNNGAISTYFEDGRVRLRTEHLAKLGSDMLTGFAIAQVTIKYRAQLGFPATVNIGSSIIHIGRTSYILGQAVFFGDECIATGEVVTVRFDAASHKPMPLEDEVRAILESVAPLNIQ
ncbi:MAG: acyl-CoA thioesterase [Gammaproteobacteria bacterium]|nr:acyl-CoA thioesterase [Gammaproteobacteria bacterium]